VERIPKVELFRNFFFELNIWDFQASRNMEYKTNILPSYLGKYLFFSLSFSGTSQIRFLEVSRKNMFLVFSLFRLLMKSQKYNMILTNFEVEKKGKNLSSQFPNQKKTRQWFLFNWIFYAISLWRKFNEKLALKMKESIVSPSSPSESSFQLDLSVSPENFNFLVSFLALGFLTIFSLWNLPSLFLSSLLEFLHENALLKTQKICFLLLNCFWRLAPF